jgi:hypothetical protein
LSGLVATLAATLLTLIATVILDRSNKSWQLKAEVRRYRVNRLVAANEGLRTCFFLAVTQLRYHLLAIQNLDAERTALQQNAVTLEEFRKRDIDERNRYNGQIGCTEATAMAHAAFLNDELIPSDVRTRLRLVMSELTQGHTTDPASIQQRIDFFHFKTPEVLALLSEVDNAISAEMRKAI